MKNIFLGKMIIMEKIFTIVKSIENINTKFDLIFIDGECRNACFDIALNYLNENGLIVFDNTSRKI